MIGRASSLAVFALVGCSVASEPSRDDDAWVARVAERAAIDLTPGEGAMAVHLPARAGEAMTLVDKGSSVAIAVQPLGIASAPMHKRGAWSMHRDEHLALAVHAGKAGVEDFVELGDRHSFSYRLTLGAGAAGVRLVDSVVEILDRSGAPRLHMAKPFVIDAKGERSEVAVAIDDCAYDGNPAAPWDRPVTAPGATTCTLRLDWRANLSPPVVLDPFWSATGTMPVALLSVLGGAIGGGKILVTGRHDTTHLYDPATKTWATTGKRVTGDGYGNSGTTLADGRFLFANGTPDLATATGKTEIYTPATGLWTAGPNMVTPRYYAALNTLKDGRVLLSGGNLTSTSTYCHQAEIYNPATNTFTNTGIANRDRANQPALLLADGRVVTVGRLSTDFYNPTTGVWTDGPVPTVTVTAATAALVPGYLVMAGVPQADQTYLLTQYLNLATNTWSAGPRSAIVRAAPTLVTLESGVVMIAGGSRVVDGNTVSSVELLIGVGATAKLVDGESMTSPRVNALASVLPSGDVLFAGGSLVVGGATTYLSSAEIFHPATNGSTCTSGGGCLSGFCVDGVCCNTACTASCMACSAANKGSGADGVCALVAAGTDPHDSCKDDGSPSCKKDGLCDAAGACRNYAVATACSASKCTADEQCSSGFCADGVCCDKACKSGCDACTRALKGSGVDGVCEHVPADVDPKNACPADVGYPGSCGADGQCDGAGACRTKAKVGTLCSDITCTAAKANSAKCDAAGVCTATSEDCAPFECHAGVGCAKSCEVDGDCDGSSYCKAEVCAAKSEDGAPAVEPRACKSGIVADSVCCNAVCDGVCESCDSPSTIGTCAPVVGGARHGSCVGSGDVCSAARCDGIARTSCAALPGPEVVCRPSACSVGFEDVVARCDGKGACPKVDTHACYPYVCGSDACLTTCKADSDCAADYACELSTSRCIGKSFCAGPTAVVGPSGERTLCYPYRCADGACLEACATSADCSAGTVCSDALCVAPVPPVEGGCSASRRPSGNSFFAVFGIAAVLLFRRRSLAYAMTLGLFGCSSGEADKPAVPSAGDRIVSLIPSRLGAGAAAVRVEGAAFVPRTVANGGARMVLPRLADARAILSRPDRDIHVGLTLESASAAPGYASEEGLIVHPDAFGPHMHLVRKPLPDGAEDFFVFEETPRSNEVRYRLDLEPSLGLRLIDRVVEVVDSGGAPRLRMEAPIVIDKNARRVAGDVRIEGCAYDSSVAPPWDRPIVSPGASSCSVVVAWPRMDAPFTVDPTWTATGSLAVARASVGSIQLATSGRVLVAGGDITSFVTQSSVELFDPATSTWSMTGSMKQARSYFRLAQLTDGRVLAPGGAANGIGIAAAELWSPTTGAWTDAKGPMSSAHQSNDVVRAGNGKVVVTGGGSTIELFTPGVDTFEALTPSSPWSMAAALPSGKVLLGFAPGTSTGSEIFDATTKTFAAGPTMPGPRGNTRSIALPDGRVLFAGGAYVVGSANYILDDALVFDESKASFSLLPGKLPQKLESLPGVALPSGNVLVVGGANPSYQSAAEIFDKTSNTWLPAGTVPDVVSGDGGVWLLPDKRVLAVGAIYNKGAWILGQADLGGTCASAADCKSGFCADGVCCNTVCNGTCMACTAAMKGSGTSGTCGPVAVARDPRNDCKDDGAITCGKNGQCNGAGACDTYPVSVACKARPCGSGADCASGFCADGICCNSACDGACESCSAAGKGSGADGVCGIALSGTDPRGRCPSDAAGSCKADGVCDSAGACRAFAVKGSPCGVTTCTAGKSAGPTCDGAGTCDASVTDCAPYACADAIRCASSCSTDAECAGDAWCSSGTCVARLENGKPATQAAACKSGALADGVCCSGACDGPCQACDLAGAVGTCTPVSGAPKHGDCPEKANDDPCSVPRCDGTDPLHCKAFVGPTVTCRDPFCSSGSERAAAKCDGSGTCPVPEGKACSPFACGDNACLSECSDNAQCTKGFACDIATKRCISADLCDGDHLIRSADSVTDCSPFKCAGTVCLTTCTSSDSCVGGTICQEGQCVTPPSEPASDGCNCSAAGRTYSAWPSLLALLGWLRRRDRRPSSTKKQ